MFLALLIYVASLFITFCFFIRAAIWVYDRFQFTHYLAAISATIVFTLCYGDEVRKMVKLIYLGKPATPELLGDADFQHHPQRESLTYLRFNHITGEYEFGNEFVQLSSSPALVSFQSLFDEKADAYFIRYIPKNVGRHQYTLAVNCKLKSPVFDYDVCSQQKPI